MSRIGPGRASRTGAWLRSHEATIGESRQTSAIATCSRRQIVEVGGHAGVLVPPDRMAVAHPLSGSDGKKRAALFPYIQAPNDLAAVARIYVSQPAEDSTRIYKGARALPTLGRNNQAQTSQLVSG